MKRPLNHRQEWALRGLTLDAAKLDPERDWAKAEKTARSWAREAGRGSLRRGLTLTARRWIADGNNPR